jgi:hypothetical protein
VWSARAKADRRRRVSRVAIALATALLAASPGCSSSGKTPAKSAKMEAPRFSKRMDPGELLPADLDLVIRFDLARMREGLGPLVADQLASKALEQRGDPMLRGLLTCADVLWVGVRLAELERADHVAIIEGKDCEVRADTSDWKKVKSANAELTIFDRLSTPARGDTSRVILAGDPEVGRRTPNVRFVVLVSAAEIASVDRVLHDGPDARRREPKAEGIVSLDLRAPRLPPDLEKKYPSIASIIAGIDRVRATTELGDKGVELEGEMVLKTSHDAERTLKFLNALRENVESDGARLMMASLHLEQIDTTVRIRWKLPAKAVLGLLDAAADKSDKPAEKAAPP